MLYTGPLVDVILLLIIFFLFGSNLVLKSGVAVNLPTSSSVLPSADEAHILTLLPESANEFFFNDRRIELSGLAEELEAAKSRSNQVILLGDEGVPYGRVMAIAEEILSQGFDLSFATQTNNP